jgi:hypothetical protein
VSVGQFLIPAALAIVVTLPTVLLIPRARQSPVFDRVLWFGTWFIALLGAWFALGNLSLPALNGLVVGGVLVVPALIGAAAGALILNGLLWGMDTFGRGQLEEEVVEGESSEESVGKVGDGPANVTNEAADPNLRG